LNKETDPSNAKMATTFGNEPAADKSINIAILAMNLDATAASIQYSYMITIDAVIELSDLVED
jgi:hypothetical protein